jgi:hypothetical protein
MAHLADQVNSGFDAKGMASGGSWLIGKQDRR